MADKTPVEIEQENRQKFAEAARAAGLVEDDKPAETLGAVDNDEPSGGTDPQKDKPSLDSGKDRQDPTEPADGGDNSEKTKSPGKKTAPANVEPTDDNRDNGADDDDMPAAMSKKHAEKWKGVDTDIKTEIKRVLDNDQQTITRFKTKNKSLEDAIAVANPEIYNDVKRFGISREQSIKNRLGLVSRFERNPDETLVGMIAANEVKFNNPAGLIRAIAAATKTDLETLTKVDPKVAELQDKTAAYEARQRAAAAAKRAEAAAQEAASQDELVEAATDFIHSHPEIQLTEAFKRQMDVAAARIMTEKPNISSRELFEESYAIIRGLTQPVASQPTVKPTAKKTVIPKKAVVSMTPSDDAGDKITQMKINVDDPEARKKLFKKLALESGLGQK